MNTFLKTHLKLASFSHWIFMKFHDFFGIDFRIDFFIDFDGKWLPKWSGEMYAQRPFLHHFRDLFRRLIFWCILVALWLTYGSILAPFWLSLAPFGILLAHFWLVVAHFWLPLTHFWRPLAHFWCPWPHFWLPWNSFFSFLVRPNIIFIFLQTSNENRM